MGKFWVIDACPRKLKRMANPEIFKNYLEYKWNHKKWFRTKKGHIENFRKEFYLIFQRRWQLFLIILYYYFLLLPNIKQYRKFAHHRRKIFSDLRTRKKSLEPDAENMVDAAAIWWPLFIDFSWNFLSFSLTLDTLFCWAFLLLQMWLFF